MAQISDLQTRFCVVWETKLRSPAESPPFSFQNFRWNLKLNLKPPTGSSYVNGLYIGHNYTLTLHAPPNVPLDRQFRVTVLLERKARNEIAHVCNVQTVRNPNQVLWDFREYQALGDLRHGYTRDDLIKFVCLLECGPPCPLLPHSGKRTIRSSGSAGSFDLPPNLESLSHDFSGLLKDKVLPDVKLKSAEKTISAHRAILAARSEVFAAIFRNKMAESETGVVDVTDLDARVLEPFLRYVYTGQIRGLSEDLVPGLYVAADKYAVRGLKKSCSDQMIATLTKNNCVNFLTVANLQSDDAFKDAVLSFICGHEAILQSEVWLRFSEKNLQLANEVYQRFVLSKSEVSKDL